MRRAIVIALSASLVISVFAMFQWVRRMAIEAVTPPLDQYPPARVQSILAAYGASAQVRRVFHVNLDTNCYIFEGDFPAVTRNLPRDMPKRSGVILGDQHYQVVFSGKYGEIRVNEFQSRRLFGIVVSTTSAEWSQYRPTFDSTWAVAVSRFRNLGQSLSQGPNSLPIALQLLMGCPDSQAVHVQFVPTATRSSERCQPMSGMVAAGHRGGRDE